MNQETILFEIDQQGIAWVTLNRPQVHNAFDEHMIRTLSDLFKSLEKDKGVRAVVIRGAGKSFSAGADLDWMKRAADFSHNQNVADAEALAVMLNKLFTLNKLTIACVQGAAMGGGFGLVACCDVAIADRNAVFSLSEVKLGMIPATISPYVLAAIGPRQSRRYCQTGERFKGDKAKEIGLVHEVVDGEDEMAARLQMLLKELDRNGPHAMREAKRIVLDYTDKHIGGEIIEDSAERIAAIRAGGEAREGLNAFLEKRPASWLTSSNAKDKKNV